MVMLDKYLQYLKIEKNASINTIKGYSSDINDFIKFLGNDEYINESKIVDVEYTVIREYLSNLHEKKYSRKTVLRKLAAIRAFYKYLVMEGYMEKNPAAQVFTPKMEKNIPEFLHLYEIDLLLDSPKPTTLGIRDKAILELLYATGIRVGELVNMDCGDIDFGYDTISVIGKGLKERRIPFGSKAKSAMKKYLNISRPELLKADEKAFLLNKNGTRLSDRSVRRIIDKYLEKVSINKNVTPIH